MKRKTLDILFSAGGLVLAVVLLLTGIVMTSNANFANNYVTSQLREQNINFKQVSALTEEEKKSACLVQYAGQQLTTGPQAECYANQFIGLHLKGIAAGKTYAELGVPETQLKKKVALATAAHSPTLPGLQAQLEQVSTQRDTLFKGETLRGLLLTSYGFSEFGRKAGQAAVAAYVGALILLLLSAAGLVHALRTPESKVVGAAPPGA